MSAQRSLGKKTMSDPHKSAKADSMITTASGIWIKIVNQRQQPCCRSLFQYTRFLGFRDVRGMCVRWNDPRRACVLCSAKREEDLLIGVLFRLFKTNNRYLQSKGGRVGEGRKRAQGSVGTGTVHNRNGC